jgi:hypothetical protein
MRLSTLIAPITLAMFTSGCGELLSTEPLASKDGTLGARVESALFDAGLLGTWFDQNDTVITVTSEKQPVYEILVINAEKGNKFRLLGQIVRFGDRQILDVTDAEGGVFSVQAHVWIHVQKKGIGIQIQYLDSKWLQEKARQSGLPLFTADGHPVLTAPTAKLLEFVRQYGTQPEARGGTMELVPFKKKK